MKVALWYWAAWGVLLGGAIALTLQVVLTDTSSLELDLITAIQKSPLPGKTVSNLIRAITQTEVDLVVGSVIALILWRSDDRRFALVLIALMVVLPLAQHELKVVVDRVRPPYDPNVLWSEPTSPSFPSGHVMSATVIYGWLLFCARSQWRSRHWRYISEVVATAALVMTSVSSLYLAVHWPSDVLGGYLWGGLLLLPGMWLAKRGPSLLPRG